MPGENVVAEFFSKVDEFLQKREDGQILGVHCTHGLNRSDYLLFVFYLMDVEMQIIIQTYNETIRTGYLICCYLMDRLAFKEIYSSMNPCWSM